MDEMTAPLCFLNTRPKAQSASFSQLVKNAGGTVMELPTIDILPVSDWQQPDLTRDRFSHAIFTSPNAVRFFFNKEPSIKQLFPKQMMIYAIGDATRFALSSQGLVASERPRSFDSQGILNLPSLQQLTNQSILIIKGKGGRTIIEKKLKQRGAIIKTINVYERCMPKYSQEQLDCLWQQPQVDIILFTSQTSVVHLYNMMSQDGWKWVQKRAALVLSERIATMAYQLGIENIIVSDIKNLSTTVKKLCARKKI